MASHDPSASDPLTAGTLVGRFVVERQLGAGGMGVVYEGSDPHLERRVAIKVLSGQRSGHAERLLREAQVLAQLSHPNVVAVHEVGAHAGQIFVAMELVDGEGLDRVMANGPLPWPRALALMLQAGRGLVAAHKKGIVHRDVKPSNVMVDRDGRVRVADFGLARLVGPDDADDGAATASAPAASTASLATTVPAGDSTSSGATDAAVPSGAPLLRVTLTRKGALLGTPLYMAPEQHDGGAVTHKADQYAFCLVFWEALHGRLPFTDRDLLALATAKRAGRIARAEGVRPPRWLVAEIERGLAPDPGARHPSMNALLERLERTPARRRRVALAVIAATGLGAAAVAGFVLAGDDAAPSCDTADSSIAAAWPKAERARLAGVLGEGGEAAARAIDEKVSAWRSARIDACRATHVRREQPADVLARRAACFDRNITELASLLAAAKRSGGPAWRIEEAARALPSADHCSVAAVAGVPASKGGPRAAEIERQYADLSTALTLARTDEAAAIAPALLAAAREQGDPHVLARVLLLHSRQIAELDRPGMRAELEEALGLASASGDAVLEAKVAIDLMALATVDEMADRAATLLPVVDAAMRRANPDRELRSKYTYHVADTYSLLGRFEEADKACIELTQYRPGEVGSCRCKVAINSQRYLDALPLCEQAVTDAEKTYGVDHPHVAYYVNDLGIVVGQLGDYDRSIALGRRALALDERAYGEASELAQRDRVNLAGAFGYAERHTEAIAMADQGIAFLEKSPNDSLLAQFLSARSRARGNSGDAAGARRDAAEALLAAERAYGRDHAAVAGYHTQVGDSLSAGQPDCPRAIAAFERAAEHASRALGPRSEARLVALHGAGECYLHLGQPDKACAVLEESLSIALDGDGTQPYTVAVNHASYGRCLLEKGNKAGAREQWLAAQKIFATVPTAKEELAELATMLRKL